MFLGEQQVDFKSTSRELAFLDSAVRALYDYIQACLREEKVRPRAAR
jgi:hypothetical protein